MVSTPRVDNILHHRRRFWVESRSIAKIVPLGVISGDWLAPERGFRRRQQTTQRLFGRWNLPTFDALNRSPYLMVVSTLQPTYLCQQLP